MFEHTHTHSHTDKQARPRLGRAFSQPPQCESPDAKSMLSISGVNRLPKNSVTKKFGYQKDVPTDYRIGRSGPPKNGHFRSPCR